MNSLSTSDDASPPTRNGSDRTSAGRTPRSHRDPDPVTDAIRDRLRRVLMRYSARQIAQATGHNHETVRRYLLAGILPADFLHAVCVVYGVCPRYLLLGTGSAMALGNAPAPAEGDGSASTPTEQVSMPPVVMARASTKRNQGAAGW